MRWWNWLGVAMMAIPLAALMIAGMAMAIITLWSMGTVGRVVLLMCLSAGIGAILSGAHRHFRG